MDHDYAHPTNDQLIDALAKLYFESKADPAWVDMVWYQLPATIRAAAGDLSALDELHGGTKR